MKYYLYLDTDFKIKMSTILPTNGIICSCKEPQSVENMQNILQDAIDLCLEQQNDMANEIAKQKDEQAIVDSINVPWRGKKDLN